MKTSTLYFIGLFIISSCQYDKTDKKPIWSYIKSNSDTKTFELTTDSSFAASIFVRQKAKQLNDTTWEFEFYWTRSDSIPINKSVERYSLNALELLEQCFYESDSVNQAIEVKAEIIGKKYFSLSDSIISCDFKYKFQTDPYLTMKIRTQFHHSFQLLDLLGEDNLDCLVITSKDQIILDYSDNRKDTTMFSNSRRIYTKGKGLIFFEQVGESQKFSYQLKD